MGTKNNPSKFDCYAAAEPDEPMFVLLGRDPTAWFLVGMWAAIRSDTKGDDEKSAEARDCMEAMMNFASERGEDVGNVLRVFASEANEFLDKHTEDGKFKTK